jgi:hypothetical protein
LNLIRILVSFGEGGFLGFLIVILSFAVPRALPEDRGQGWTDTAIEWIQTLMGRSLLLKRAHGGVTLLRTKYDPKLEGEKGRIGREEKYWRDVHGMMGRLGGKPFGMAHEKRDQIFDARTAWAAHKFRDLVRTNRWTQNDYRKAYLAVEEQLPTVDLDAVLAVIPWSAKPGLPDRLAEYRRKGQEGYNTLKGVMLERMTWFLAWAIGFGGMYLAMKLGASGGGIVSRVNF